MSIALIFVFYILNDHDGPIKPKKLNTARTPKIPARSKNRIISFALIRLPIYRFQKYQAAYHSKADCLL
jgi:hypothetical protein